MKNEKSYDDINLIMGTEDFYEDLPLPNQYQENNDDKKVEILIGD